MDFHIPESMLLQALIFSGAFFFVYTVAINWFALVFIRTHDVPKKYEQSLFVKNPELPVIAFLTLMVCVFSNPLVRYYCGFDQLLSQAWILHHQLRQPTLAMQRSYNAHINWQARRHLKPASTPQDVLLSLALGKLTQNIATQIKDWSANETRSNNLAHAQRKIKSVKIALSQPRPLMRLRSRVSVESLELTHSLSANLTKNAERAFSNETNLLALCQNRNDQQLCCDEVVSSVQTAGAGVPAHLVAHLTFASSSGMLSLSSKLLADTSSHCVRAPPAG